MTKRFGSWGQRLGLQPAFFSLKQPYSYSQWVRDLGAGFTVAMVALPLAMAFAIASGLSPQTGLFTAIVAGIVIASFSGSPVQIGGPAGAFIVVVYDIVQQHGVAGMLGATFLSGIFLWLMGLLRLGVLIKFIPVAVIIGFTNGIAVLIAFSQLADFLGLSLTHKPAAFVPLLKALYEALPTLNGHALVVGMASLLVMVWWQFWVQKRAHGRGQVLRLVPASVVALVLALCLVKLLNLHVETIGSRFGGIPQGLPPLSMPRFSGLSALLLPALTLALLGAIESLLCARVADNLLHERHRANQELMAQGFANMLTPWLSGMPATGTIARTVTNIKSGGRTPVAGIMHAVILLLVMLFLAPWAYDIPLPCLSAILLFVAWNMGEWHAFRDLRQYRWPYRLTLLAVFTLTVVVDLTVAVGVGMVLAMVVFIYRISQLTDMEREKIDEDTEIVQITGVVFFGAVQHFETLEDTLPARCLILDLSGVTYMDSTGAEALSALWRVMQEQQVALWLCGLRPQVAQLLQRIGFIAYLSQAPFADRQSALAACGRE